MRVTLLHNPEAGADGAPTRGQLKALVRERGHTLRYRSVKKKHRPRALAKPADVIAVAGGDGTVCKVARRISGRGVPVAILPLGTANNVSRTLGIAGLPIPHLIRSWKSAHAVPFDAGIARGPWGRRRFFEAAGIGVFAASIQHVDGNRTVDDLPDTEIKLAYTTQLLRDRLDACRGEEIRAVLDGRDISGRDLLFEVMLMKFVGPNLYLAPEAVGDDGLFDVVLIDETDRETLREHLAKWQEGVLWPAAGLPTMRGKHLRIEWSGFPMHIDDGVWPFEADSPPRPPATIELAIERSAVEFLVPKDLPPSYLSR